LWWLHHLTRRCPLQYPSVLGRYEDEEVPSLVFTFKDKSVNLSSHSGSRVSPGIVVLKDNLLHARQDLRIWAIHFCKVPTYPRRNKGVDSEHITPLYPYLEGSIHDFVARIRGPDCLFSLFNSRLCFTACLASNL
jgi:hypothetical protein